MAGEVWEVVGGADKGGILVRAGRDTKSPELAKRLAFGAQVQQLDLQTDRLNYWLLQGDGPESGWVSVKLKDKVLLSRKRDEVAAASLPHSADRERRSNTRKALQMQMDAMPYMRLQFQAQVDALDMEDARELAALRGETLSAPRAQTTVQRPAPASQPATVARALAPRPAPTPVPPAASARQAVVREVEEVEEVEDVPLPSAADFLTALDMDGEDEVEDVASTQPAPAQSTEPGAATEDIDAPSIEELLVRIDYELDANAEPDAPPSVEEMLAQLEKDEKEEEEFEESLRDRDRFFDLGSVVGTAIMKLTPDPFADLTADNVSLPTKFSYGNMNAFGNICLERARSRMKDEEPREAAETSASTGAEAG